MVRQVCAQSPPTGSTGPGPEPGTECGSSRWESGAAASPLGLLQQEAGLESMTSGLHPRLCEMACGPLSDIVKCIGCSEKSLRTSLHLCVYVLCCSMTFFSLQIIDWKHQRASRCVRKGHWSQSWKIQFIKIKSLIPKGYECRGPRT